MASSNFFLDNEDLLFQVKHGVDWDALARLAEADFTLPDGPRSTEEAVAFYTEVLTAAGEVAAKEIAPRAPSIDRRGAWLEDGDVRFDPELQKAKQAVTAVGLHGVSTPRELGGSNCPAAVYFIISELLGRADAGALADFGFHAGIAATMRIYSAIEGSVTVENGRVARTRWDEEIKRITAGEESGCMVLTEPGAGSDLGGLRTRAVLEDGKWLLTGEKVFITNGQSQHHFVLAKTEEESGAEGDGLKALSLFWVPRWMERDGKRVENVKVTKVEEKIGHHGSPTCSLLYERSEGQLVGRRGQGFQLMLFLMNSARLSVGVEAIGNAEAAYRAAREYASERRTMGKPIAQHELVAEILMEMETWIAALRALAFEAINAAELGHLLQVKLQLSPPTDPLELAELTAQQSKAAKKARRLTPLLKYLAAEKGVEICRNAMQVHGGMGYVERGVHRHLRDALVLPVYEGTSQIQALMATKDHLMAAVRNPTAFLRRSTRARVLARTAEGELARMVARADAALASATEKLLLRIFGSKLRAEWQRGVKGKDARSAGQYLMDEFMRKWDARADFSHGLLHAERLTRLLADVAIGKILLKQAQHFPERRGLAERFVHRMVLRAEATAREIHESDRAVFDRIASDQTRAESA